MSINQKITRSALLIALCVVLGYIFLPIPNLEMITAGIFLSGLWMGPAYGAFIGFAAEAIYSTSNPMGFPPPPLFVAQVAAMSLVGFAGGLLRRALQRRRFFQRSNWPHHLALGATGIILTFIYDLLTTLSFPIAAGFTSEQTRLALLMGIPYAGVHMVTNALIFILLVPAVLNRFPDWRSP